MNDNHGSKAGLVAQGWILMFLVLICIFLTEVSNNIFANELQIYQSSEGKMALKAMVMLMMLHAFVPMLVCTIDAPWFRWTVVGITGMLTLVMVGHEIMDMVRNVREFSIFHMLDFTHHVLGVWVTLIALAWATESRAASASMKPKAV